MRGRWAGANKLAQMQAHPSSNKTGKHRTQNLEPKWHNITDDETQGASERNLCSPTRVGCLMGGITRSTPLTGHDSDHGLNRIRIRFWDELGSCWITILMPDPIPCPWTHLDPGPWAHLGPGPLGPWAHLGPGPTWALGPFGPWAHLGPRPIWALGPFGPKAHLGPGPIWALRPYDTPPKA